MTISQWINQSTSILTRAGITSARLDAELMLAYQLEQSRTWLIAHQNDNIDDLNVLENASKLLEERLNRIPLAYITNHKEFYNRSFFVDTSVLIPRPESETIIDLVKELLTASEEDVAAGQPSAMGVKPHKVTSKDAVGNSLRVIDVGTGSGCLGITAKLEFPQLSVTLSDISKEALAVAHKNAKALGAKPIRYVQSDLLDHWLSHKNPQKFDVIIANLPYVDRNWERSPETDHEPALALFADDHGMELIKKCIQQASIMTSVNGYLVLEADPEQHQEIIQHAASVFKHVVTKDYVVLLQRTAMAA
jgi:release factor glutamine methyltransferase